MQEEVGADPWEQSVALFVEANLPMPRSRVLDVGCGDGWLTRRLDEAGYDVKGIDPEAPDGPLFDRVGLDDFTDASAFDAAVAVLSLHHIADLKAAVTKIADLLKGQGTLVVVEFAWDRFDEATARWCLDRLPSELDPDNWLHHRLAEMRDARARGEVLTAAERFHRWAAEEGFHSSSAILAELGERFRERSLVWSPYLFPELEGVTEADERAAIGLGTIQSIGVRFVGRRLR